MIRILNLYSFMYREHVYDLEKRRADYLMKWLIMLGFMDLRGPMVCRRSASVLYESVIAQTECLTFKYFLGLDYLTTCIRTILFTVHQYVGITLQSCLRALHYRHVDYLLQSKGTLISIINQQRCVKINITTWHHSPCQWPVSLDSVCDQCAVSAHAIDKHWYIDTDTKGHPPFHRNLS